MATDDMSTVDRHCTADDHKPTCKLDWNPSIRQTTVCCVKALRVHRPDFRVHQTRGSAAFAYGGDLGCCDRGDVPPSLLVANGM